MLIKIAINSLFNRRATVLLTVVSIMVSVYVLMAVEHLKVQAKDSFSRGVSGVDLIVGGRTGSLNLLLSSVFRMGNTSTSISWQSVEALEKHKQVKWVIPIALGDSHKGYRVLATDQEYFEHFKYGDKQALEFISGQQWAVNTEQAQVVIGAEVARKLGYQIGDKLILSHGTGITSFTHHDGLPFTLVGILKATGTPVDQTLHIRLEDMVRMHESPAKQNQHRSAGVQAHSEDEHEHHHDEHKHDEDKHDEHKHDEHHEHAGHAHDVEKVSAVLLGLKAKFSTLMVQKYVNDFQTEPLMAVIPGVALTELWRLMGSVEVALQVISVLVLLAALLGLVTMLLASMQERMRELSILRALGASPWFIFVLIELEVLLITTVAVMLAILGLSGTLSLLQPWFLHEYGLFISAQILRPEIGQLILNIAVVALVSGGIPASVAYRKALQSGLTINR